MAVTDTGRILAELHARTGLSWQQLAETIGASSGDYVRKVAGGAKPGNNLAGAVGELMQRGRVVTAPERRRAASGELAKVRAPASSGAPSRIPEQQQVKRAAKREVFRMGGGRLGWTQELAADDPDAIRAAVRSAGRGRHRVSFRVHYIDANGRDRYATVGQKGGYRTADALKRMGSDPVAWLGTQVGSHYGAFANTSVGGIDVDDEDEGYSGHHSQQIIGIEVIAE
jgi:hypothetical protein